MKTSLINRIKKMENKLTPKYSQKDKELYEKIRKRNLKVFGEEECRIRDAFEEKYPFPAQSDLAQAILIARKRMPLYEKFKAEYKKKQVT